MEDITRSPFCRHLRSKKYFLLTVLPAQEGDYLDGSQHCWCYETQIVVGPDGGKVEPARCGPERRCYESSL